MIKTDPPGNDLKMQFEMHGFLAPYLDDERKKIRDQLADDFAEATVANQHAQRAYYDALPLMVGRLLRDPFSNIVLNMHRALSAYQGGILLIERGMAADALSLGRIVFEAGFWMGYIQKMPDAANKHFLAAYLANDIRASEASLEISSGDRRKELTAALDELRQFAQNIPMKTISIREVARKSGFNDAYPFYSKISAGSVHVSAAHGQTAVYFTDDRSATGHKVGPEWERAKSTLALLRHAIWYPTNALLSATAAMNAVTK